MVLLIQLLVIAVIVCIRLWGLLGKSLRVSKDGNKPEHLEAVAYHKGRLSRCWFGLKQEHGFPFVIRRERWYHRVLKAMGIASELQARDNMLDNNWFFITDHPDHLERALRSEALREALRSLLRLHVNKVVSTPHRLWCEFDCRKMQDRAITKPAYWQKLEAVQEKLRHLPRPQQQRFPLRWQAYIFLGLHMGFFVVAAFGFLPTLIDNHEIISRIEWASHALIYALPAVCLWFVAIMLLFHGTSWAGWVVTDFVLVGILGLLITSGYFVREVNILADTSAPIILERTVENRYCQLKCHKSCGKNCTRRSQYNLTDAQCSPTARTTTRAHYQAADNICRANANFQFTLSMQPWRKAQGARYSYHPSAEVYDRTRKGTLLAIPRRAGALDIEWVDTNSIQPLRY